MESCAEWAKAIVCDKAFRILNKDTKRPLQEKEVLEIGCIPNEAACPPCDAELLTQ